MINPRRILIIQLKRAGDVLLTTPIAALLKQHWPGAQVDFLVDRAFAALLEHNPAIDTVRIYERRHLLKTWKRLREASYDLVFDFQSSPRSVIAIKASRARKAAGYRVPFWGRFYDVSVRRPDGSMGVTRGKTTLLEPFTGPLKDIPGPRMVLTPAERVWAKAQQKDVRGRKIIGLIATHRRDARRWSADQFAELAKQFDQAGHAVWLFWGPGEEAYVQGIHQAAPHAWMVPSTTLRQMAALLSRCSLVATNDNGPMHIAVAVGVPTVTIYGPTDPLAWNPGGPRHAVVQASDVTCLGCNLNRCPFEHECMTHIAPRQVFAASESLIKGAPAAKAKAVSLGAPN